jgi:methionyl aminopeptidase
MAWERNIVIKNKKELEIMREAGRINAKALHAVREAVQPGVTTAELDKIAETVIRKHQGTPAFLGYPGPTPYPGTINASINEEMVHGLPSKKRFLQEGDLLSVDCGTVFNGFVADSAFSVGVGEISQEVKQLIEVGEKALEIGISKMRAGNRVGDVSSAIQKYVEKFGYNVPREYTGHGVGREMHEGPQVPNFGLPGRGIVLKPGMTIALEPMLLAGTYYTKILKDLWTVTSADDKLTTHSEHTIAVTDGEPRILTLL